VVIVGSGRWAAAAWPLARAGIEVGWAEAGRGSLRVTSTPRVENNFRGWPQAAQKANSEIHTHRHECNRRLSRACRFIR